MRTEAVVWHATTGALFAACVLLTWRDVRWSRAWAFRWVVPALGRKRLIQLSVASLVLCAICVYLGCAIYWAYGLEAASPSAIDLCLLLLAVGMQYAMLLRRTEFYVSDYENAENGREEASRA